MLDGYYGLTRNAVACRAEGKSEEMWSEGAGARAPRCASIFVAANPPPFSFPSIGQRSPLSSPPRTNRIRLTSFPTFPRRTSGAANSDRPSLYRIGVFALLLTFESIYPPPSDDSSPLRSLAKVRWSFNDRLNPRPRWMETENGNALRTSSYLVETYRNRDFYRRFDPSSSLWHSFHQFY